ncbi:hypothetical protein ACHEXK_04785 [Limnohabitans sp. DCL3]|uniref:hypothetical protein n=1 Tax=Limnohabitans sp. DCL3 TaxID=3374103 RepID=UPI003A84543F
MYTGHWMIALASWGWGLCGLLTPLASAATDHFTAITAADPPAKAAKPKRTKAPQPQLKQGTGESQAERDKRLFRECRGKTNAGACEGFAS